MREDTFSCCCMDFAAHRCCKGWCFQPYFCPRPPRLAPLLAVAVAGIPGLAFFSFHSCARSAYPRPAPCCAKADWLNQPMVNLLLMFRASLDLPIVAAVIAPLLLFDCLMALSQGLEMGSQVNS